MRRCIPILLLLMTAASADGVTRTFGGWPTVPFRAEFVMRFGHSDGSTTYSQERVWYASRDLYRTEGVIQTGPRPDWPRIYVVRRGSHAFSATVYPGGPIRWYAWPASWMPDTAAAFLRRRDELTEPKLVGCGVVEGLPAEHWRGRVVGPHRSARVDLWVSKDPRFPLVLRRYSRGTSSTSTIEVIGLDLISPIPDYVFTPSIHPRGGFMAAIALPYKPLHLLVLWQIALLLCYAGFAVPLAAGKRRWPRALLCVLSSAGVIGLLLVRTGRDMYLNQWSDVPVLLLFATITAVSMVLMWRKARPQGEVAPFFRGASWFVVPIATAALALGTLWQFANQRVMIGSILTAMGKPGLSLLFLPATLCCVVLLTAPFVALEELVFRGYILGALRSRLRSPTLAVVLQAIPFGLLHIPRGVLLFWSTPKIVADVIGVTLMGILLGMLRLRYRNLGAPWLIHLAYNTGSTYVIYASAYWGVQALSR